MDLRGDKVPESVIQERLRLKGRDWLQYESEERIDILIQESIRDAPPDRTKGELDQEAVKIRSKEKQNVMKGEEESRQHLAAGRGSGKAKGRREPWWSR
jgi:hypothetical protein